MGMGISLFFLALGAILAFAVDADVEGIDIETVGVILMVVGGIGLLASLAFWGSWGGYGVRRTRVTRTSADGRVVEDRRDDVV